MSLKHGSKDPCTPIFLHIVHVFGVRQNVPFGYCHADADPCPRTHRVHGIYCAKNVRMPHTETDSSISSNENSGDAAGVSVGQGSEICIDVRHNLLDHEVFPVAGRGRVDIPRASEGGFHIDSNTN